MHKYLNKIIFTLCTATLFAASPTQPSLGGWITYWGAEKGMTSSRMANGQLDDAFLFIIQLDKNGMPVSVAPERDTEWQRRAAELRRMKIKLWLTVVNDTDDLNGHKKLKDPTLSHALLNDLPTRKRHITKLLSLCDKFGTDGIDIDYENLLPEDRNHFTQFIQELSQALHAKNRLLAVTVQPKIRETKSIGTGAADWAALGKAADRLQIMMYNLHNTRTPPGPVATLSWMDKVMAFASGQCDPAKIVPALKVSGFEWGEHPRELDYREFVATGGAAKPPFQRDPDGNAPFLTYKAVSEQRTVYLEDADSLMTKVNHFVEKGYPKVVFWSLGSEDPAFWSKQP